MATSEFARSGTIQSGPFTLPYSIEGKGQPAIVVGSVLYYTKTFSPNLRDHLELTFLDHRGFAPSPGPVTTDEFTIDVLVDDIEKLRAHLGMDKIIIIGHSGHSYMALEYAKKYPEHTSHVVMIGISPRLGEEMLAEAEENWQTLADEDRRAAEVENMARISDEELANLAPDQQFIQAYVRNAARVWFNPRFDCNPLWDGVTINMDMFNHVWGDLFTKIDVTKGLEDLEVPVFMALGRYDFIVAPPSSWDPILPLFRDVTVRIFEKSGHTPQYEEAELFDKELISWLESIG